VGPRGGDTGCEGVARGGADERLAQVRRDMRRLGLWSFSLAGGFETFAIVRSAIPPSVDFSPW
jgi:hypothetical protein